MDSNENKEYELSYLAASEQDAAAAAEHIRALGAEAREERPASRIRLAYPVGKREEAFFGALRFSAAPAKAKELEERLRLDGRVLRSILVTPPPLKEKRHPVEGAAPERPAPARPRAAEPRTAPLSNEALEKKIEEILQ